MLHRVEEIVFPVSVLVLSIEIPVLSELPNAVGTGALEFGRELFVRLDDFEQKHYCLPCRPGITPPCLVCSPSPTRSSERLNRFLA